MAATAGRRAWLAVTCAALGLTGCTASGMACATAGPEPLADARLYVEHNDTDADTGVHAAIGGEPWSQLCVAAPDGTVLVDVAPRATLGTLGLSDLLWESNEPPNDDYPIDQLRRDFPEGDYAVAATGVDGIVRTATARFTHAVPAAPVIATPTLFGEEEVVADVAPQQDLTVRWEPVDAAIDGAPVTIVAYEVIVTQEEHDDPDALSRPVSDTHVGPTVTSLTVPGAFLQPDTLYELEVLALEASGNQTITVGFFATTG